MKKQSFMLSAAAVVSLSTLLAGFGGVAGFAQAATKVAHRGPQYGGTLVEALPDPWTANLIPLMDSSLYTQSVWANQFLYLIGESSNGQLSKQGGVVDNWTISPNKTTYTFWINPKARWSNGQKVTSNDVKLGVDYLASKSYNTTLGGVYGYMVQSIVGATSPLKDGMTPSGFKIISPSEFQIKTIHADAAVLDAQLDQIVPLPSSVLGKYPISTWNKIPFDHLPTVGDGAWVISKIVPNETIVQSANPYFQYGKPYISTFEWQVVSPDVVAGDLANGTVTLSAIPAKSVSGLKAYPKVKLAINTGYGYGFLAWRLNDVTYGKEFRNVNFRQAVEYAINRNAYIKAFDKGYGIPQNGPLPDVSGWYNKSLLNAYPYNPSMANKLLNQAGFKKGKDGWRTTPSGQPFTPTITYSSNDTTLAQEANAIATWLQAVGIHVKLNPPTDFNSILHMQENDANGSQPLEGFLEGISYAGPPDPDPRGTFRTTDGYNQTTWDWTYKDKWTSLSDKIIAEQASAKAFNNTYRKNLINQWQKLWSDRLPMNFLDNADVINAYQSNLHGLTVNALGLFHPWTMYLSN